MTHLVDQSIAELRATHDRLAAHVASLSPDQLTGPSGADDWTVADVLSHLGSGAEIGRGPLLAALGDDGRATRRSGTGGTPSPRPSRRPASSRATRVSSSSTRA